MACVACRTLDLTMCTHRRLPPCARASRPALHKRLTRFAKQSHAHVKEAVDMVRCLSLRCSACLAVRLLTCCRAAVRAPRRTQLAGATRCRARARHPLLSISLREATAHATAQRSAAPHAAVAVRRFGFRSFSCALIWRWANSMRYFDLLFCFLCQLTCRSLSFSRRSVARRRRSAKMQRACATLR